MGGETAPPSTNGSPPNEPPWVAAFREKISQGSEGISEPPPYDPDEYHGDIDFRSRQKGLLARWVGGIAGVALAGLVSAFLWNTYRGGLPIISSGMSEKPTPKDSGEAVALKDLRGQIQSLTELLTAQQRETKRLSDQVTALNAKIDALPAPAASAQAALPTVAPAIAQRPRKKPSLKPPARISTGGAPLPPPMQLNR